MLERCECLVGWFPLIISPLVNLNCPHIKMGLCTSKIEEFLLLKKKPVLSSVQPLTRNIGSIRESYILIKNLGSGSLGSVFLVKDKRTGLERAAKELMKSLLNMGVLDDYYDDLAKLINIVIWM